MKKRIVSLLMAICLVVGLLPVTAMASDPAASVDGVEYPTLTEAFIALQSAADKTITLLRNVDYTEENSTKCEAVDVSGVTIDLKNHTLTTGYCTDAPTEPLLVLLGDFTLKNGYVQASGSYGIFTGNVAGAVDPSKVAKIENVTVLDGGINAGSRVELTWASAVGYDYYAVWSDNGGDVTIKDGLYSSDGAAVLGVSKNGSITVEGGIFNALGNTPMVLGGDNGKPLIKGGTFNKDMTTENATLDESLQWKNVDGKWTVETKPDDPQPAAKNDWGDTYYTLQEAVDAATLYDNITLLRDVTEDITIANEKGVAIKLDGHMLHTAATVQSGGYLRFENYNFTTKSTDTATWVTNNGDQPVVTVEAGGEFELSQGGMKGNVLIQNNGGTLTLGMDSWLDGTVNGTASNIYASAKFSETAKNSIGEVSGKTWLATATPADHTGDWYIAGTAAIQVGEKQYGFSDLQLAIDQAGEDETVKLLSNVTASVIVGADKKITLDLNGKTLEGAKPSVQNQNPTLKNLGSLTITGNGTIKHNTNSRFDGDTVVNEGTLTIENGKFQTKTGHVSLKNNADKENLIVTGGTFAEDISSIATPGDGLQFSADGKGVEEKIDDTNAVAKVVDAEGNAQNYKTLQAALNAAADGDTVKVLKNTDEDIVLPLKSLTLTSEGTSKPVLSGKFEFAAGVMPDGAEVTIENLAFENTSISLIAWSKTTNMDKMNGLTIRSNTFTGTPSEGGNIYAIHINNADVAVNNLTITGNEFFNCGTGDGGCVYATACGTLTVTDNAFHDSAMNALTLTGKDTNGHTATSAEIARNDFDNWAASPADRTDGRAMRLSNFDCDVDLTENSFVSENLPEEYVKLTGLEEDKTADMDRCYWGGEAPAADKLIGVKTVMSYYEDAEMTELVFSDDAVASVNGQYYTTLKDAVDAAADGDTVTLLKDVEDGCGVIVNKSITIDFDGHSYTIASAPLAGSGDKYATQAFQLLAGDANNPNTVVMKNGTIVLPESTPNLKMGIQNYTNLTLDGMTLDASENNNILYVLSNNNGSTTLTGGTVLKAAGENVAFDVYDFSSGGYGDVSVSVIDATIVGKIEVSESEKAALVISGGTFDREIPAKYCAEGFLPVKNSDGTYGVKNASLTITPSVSKLIGGGMVFLTVTPADLSIDVTVTCSQEDIRLTANANGVYIAYLPNANASYTFTAAAEGLASADCTVTVVRGYIPNPDPNPGRPVKPTYAVDAPAQVKGGSVSVSPTRAASGTSVTVTAVPDKGYVLDQLTVTDSTGSRVRLTEKADGVYTFLMPGSGVTVDAKFVRAITFTDVRESDYFYSAVNWALENDITSGTSDIISSTGTFSPYDSCTRAQAVAFLWRALGCPEPEHTVVFTDVDPDAYYADAVAWAVENGITVGMGNNMFSPDAVCTRAQIVSFLWRAAGEPVVAASGFTDVDPDAYYAGAVAWAVKNGITVGMGNNMFIPDGVCTRAQIVSFLYRQYA